MGSSSNRSLQAKNEKSRRGAKAFGVDMAFRNVIDRRYRDNGVATVKGDDLFLNKTIPLLTVDCSNREKFRQHF